MVVTGDHAHSTQIVGGSADDGKQLATVQTADGDPMTVAYSTNAVGSDHTGAQIRVAASGPQAANVTGVIDQTDLFATLLGRTPSIMPGTPAPTPPGTPGTPGSPAPSPVPAVAKPAASVVSAPSIARTALARRGLRVAVAATGGQTTIVRLVKDGKTLVSKRLSSTGGRVTLKTNRSKVGKLKAVVTVTGAGGTVTDSQRVRVTRR